MAGLAFLYSSERASAAAFSCRGLYLAVATVPTVQSTTSTTPVNVPGAGVTILAENCVRVQFSAQVLAPSPSGLRVRLLVDGAPAGIPVAADLRTTGGAYDNRVVTFVVRNIAEGTRRLRIQYSSIDGTRVRLNKAVMSVWYTEPPQ